MAAPETLHARKAALLLHSLPALARRQVISKLDAAQATRLQPLLDELNELGISCTLGHQLDNLASSSADEANGPLSAQQQAMLLTAEDVARCLDACAPTTVAQLLRAAEWPWKEQVLDRMRDTRRTKILDNLRRDLPPLSPMVLHALCERLCSDALVAPVQPRLFEAPVVRPVVKDRLRRLIRWMR